MLLLGIDIGTSSVKVAVTDPQTGLCIASGQFPEDTESGIVSVQPGWAEQSPEMWWQHVQKAIAKANASGKYHPNRHRCHWHCLPDARAGAGRCAATGACVMPLSGAIAAL